MWDEQLHSGETICAHGPQCRIPHCDYGKCVQAIHFLTGIYLSISQIVGPLLGGPPRLIQVNLDECKNRGISKKEHLLAGTDQYVGNADDFAGASANPQNSAKSMLSTANSSASMIESGQHQILTGIRIPRDAIQAIKRELFQYQQSRNEKSIFLHNWSFVLVASLQHPVQAPARKQPSAVLYLNLNSSPYSFVQAAKSWDPNSTVGRILKQRSSLLREDFNTTVTNTVSRNQINSTIIDISSSEDDSSSIEFINDL